MGMKVWDGSNALSVYCLQADDEVFRGKDGAKATTDFREETEANTAESLRHLLLSHQQDQC